MDSDLSSRKRFFYASRGIYNLNKTSENTRDWALIVSRFLTSDLEQYDQEKRGGIFFRFFWKTLPWIFIFFLFGKCAPSKIFQKHT